VKTCAASESVTAVRDVLRGESYMSRTISRDEVNYLRRTETDLKLEEERLTERQREVLQLLARGQADEGDWQHTEYDDQNGGVSQVSDHGGPRRHE